MAVLKVSETRYKADYAQFASRSPLRIGRSIAEALLVPVLWPLAVACRYSPILFRTASEALSLIPYVIGIVIRSAFYRSALHRCGRNVIVEFGTIFLYSDVSVGDNVLIGRYNIIHHCDFGDYVLTSERCTFLSGAHYHHFDRTDIPMALQGGELVRIGIASDCWIGAHAVIMNSVGPGAIVGAGSVVTKPVEEYSIVAGSPATVRRRRR